jgi:hypothetical protein
MSKTPEELAEEYAVITTNNLFYREPLSNAFLAGYKAGERSQEAKIKELQNAIIQSVNAMAGVKYDDENT